MANRKGAQDVYNVAMGERPRIVLARNGPTYTPTWSPDATKIAVHGYDAYSPAADDAIYVYDLIDGSMDRRIETGSAEAHPSWAPDGTILFTGGDGFVHAVGRGEPRRLVRGEFPDMSAARRLAFVRDDALWITERGRRGAQRIPGTDGATAPDWDPDGGRVVFAAWSGAHSRIYVLDAATRSLRRISPRRGLHLAPSFSPDGLYVAYTTGVARATTIRVVRATGGPSRRIGPRGWRFSEPEWWPG